MRNATALVLALTTNELHGLADAYGVPEFTQRAETWSRYMRAWLTMPRYTRLYVTPLATRHAADSPLDPCRACE